jgi:hypothetical protein
VQQLGDECSSNDSGDGPQFVSFAGLDREFYLHENPKTLRTLQTAAFERWDVVLGPQPLSLLFSYKNPQLQNYECNLACDGDVTHMHGLFGERDIIKLDATWTLTVTPSPHESLTTPVGRSTPRSPPSPSTSHRDKRRALNPQSPRAFGTGDACQQSPAPHCWNMDMDIEPIEWSTEGIEQNLEGFTNDELVEAAGFLPKDGTAADCLVTECTGATTVADVVVEEDDAISIDAVSATSDSVEEVEAPSDASAADSSSDDAAETILVVPPVKVGQYMSVVAERTLNNGALELVVVAVQVTEIASGGQVSAVTPLFNGSKPLIEAGALPKRDLFQSAKAGGWLLFRNSSAAKARDTTGHAFSLTYQLNSVKDLVQAYNEEQRAVAAQRVAKANQSQSGNGEAELTQEMRDFPDAADILYNQRNAAGFTVRCVVCHRRRKEAPGEKWEAAGESRTLSRFLSRHCTSPAHRAAMADYLGQECSTTTDDGTLSTLEINRQTIDRVITPLKEDHPSLFATLQIDRIQGTVTCTAHKAEKEFIRKNKRVVQPHLLLHRLRTHYEARLREAAKEMQKDARNELKKTRARQAASQSPPAEVARQRTLFSLTSFFAKPTTKTKGLVSQLVGSTKPPLV